MDLDKKIFWICSYPKSGNTWVRLLLCALFFTNDGDLTNYNLLNLLKKVPNFDQLIFFKFIERISHEDYKKIFSCSEYNDDSIITYAKYWIEAQKRMDIKGDFGLFKTHNARLKINENFFTDSSTTRGFIYISRDPRDIVISRSAFQGSTYDKTIDILTNAQLSSRAKIKDRMPEITLNWGEHYNSWKNFSAIPSLFIKYEDLVNDTRGEIEKILFFFKKNYNIKIDNQDIKITNAINSTNFQKLKEKESKDGFYKSKSSFFREGKYKQWSNRLSKKQIETIEKKFEKEMIDLGYL